MTADRSKFRVLVVDNEPAVRRLLRLNLAEAGYLVREADSGRGGLGELALEKPDAVILDLELPDIPGETMVASLRAETAVPVLALSTSAEEGQKIAAFDAGADDYVVKPFSSGELLARVRAMLRRIKPAVAANVFRFGTIEIDLARRRVTKSGKVVKLTSMEYALLQLFVTHREKALTHGQILAELWGPRAEGQTHYLRTYMMRLRRKLEVDGDAPRHFLTESGVGYRFVVNA